MNKVHFSMLPVLSTLPALSTICSVDSADAVNASMNDRTNEVANHITKPVRCKKSKQFENYISRVNDSDTEITSNVKQQLNSVICFLARRISSIAEQLVLASGKKTCSETEVVNSVRILIENDEMFERIANASTEAISVLESTQLVKDNDVNGKKARSRQAKAGIVFPPSVAEKYLRKTHLCVSKNAPFSLAAILEEMTRIVLNRSSELVKKDQRVRITIRDVHLAVENEKVLKDLWKRCNIILLGGGVVPNIHESLLIKKPKKRKAIIDEDYDLSTIDKKARRFRPGTVSIREIKKIQKTSNCLVMARILFARTLRNTVRKYTDGLKISKNVFSVMQYYIEQYIVQLLKNSNELAIHANRVKLISADIDLALRLIG